MVMKAINWFKDTILDEASTQIFNTNDVIDDDEEDLKTIEGHSIECHAPADDSHVSGNHVVFCMQPCAGFKDFGVSPHVEESTIAKDPLYSNDDVLHSPPARFNNDFLGFHNFGVSD
jgi:hypothetical protein